MKLSITPYVNNLMEISKNTLLYGVKLMYICSN